MRALLVLLLMPFSIHAATCSDMEVFDYESGMCMPLPMADMPMNMLMFHANAFATGVRSEGPRGREALVAPNMEMTDFGNTVGNRHYFNIDVMTTFEKWTYPQRGYPELLQFGEEDRNQIPYLDAQHPHSSPIMGLTFSDTIHLGEGKDHVKIFFAPRGSSTDGPLAFMHRPTGQAVNPDAPLGHHIGQDVGHISSSVFGATMATGHTRWELSTFNGTEPQPEKVDLPMSTPNSAAARMIEEFSPAWTAMASLAYVRSPEPAQPQLDHLWRVSASLYTAKPITAFWSLNNSLIYGMVNGLDNTSGLNSFLEEFSLNHGPCRIWGRIEVLQRTAAELQVPLAVDVNRPLWVSAYTLGYTHFIYNFQDMTLNAGLSLSRDLLPGPLRSAYGGDPFSGKIFVQLSAMKMWDL